MKSLQPRYFFIKLIVFYQKTLSPAQGSLPRLLGRTKATCIFYPSCSEYAKEAFLRHGTIGGVLLTARRILRCNPFHSSELDPVPEKFSLRVRARTDK